MAITNQVREILIKIDTRGDQTLRALAKNFKETNSSIKETTSAVTSFRNAFLAIQGLSFAGVGLSELTSAADTYQLLSDRLRNFEGDQNRANAVLNQLVGVAERTKSTLDGVATVYSRLGQSLKETGLGSESLLFLTEQLQNSFRIGGATTAEATAATIQLSQGLATGALRGQELNSVLEANVVFGGLLAKQLGVTRGELKAMAEQGKITTEVVLKAVAAGAADAQKQVANLGTTFKSANDAGLLKFNVALGELNQQLGLSDKYGRSIGFLTDNLQALSTVAAGLAVATIPSLVAGLIRLGPALLAAATAINPLAVGLGLLTTGTLLAITNFEKFEQLGFEIRASFVLAFTSISESIYDVLKGFSLLASFGKGDFLTKFAQAGIDSARQLRESVLKDLNEVREGAEKMKIADAAFDAAGTTTFEEKLRKFNESLRTIQGTSKNVTKTLQQQIRDLNSAFAEGDVPVQTYNATLLRLTTQLYAKKGPIPLANALDKLNKENLGRELEAQIITIEQFQDAVRKIDIATLNRKLANGAISSGQFAEGMREINDRMLEINQQLRDNQLRTFNEDLARGALSVTEYTARTRELKIEELNEKFRSGKLDVAAYNSELIKTSTAFLPGSAFSTGLRDYINSAGTLSQGISTVVTNTFGRLEDSLVEFTKNGKFAFEDFASAVLEDLNRIILRSLVIRPLAEGILGGIGAASAGTDAAGGTTSYSSDYLAGNTGGYAKGGAFHQGGTEFFAKGGVVNQPTAFRYNGGKRGVMGEAGPEAILPLKRDSSGSLGVKAAPSNTYVNITNNSGATIEERGETTAPNGDKTLEIVILSTVQNGISSGKLDKTFKNSYGMNRRGM